MRFHSSAGSSSRSGGHRQVDEREVCGGQHDQRAEEILQVEAQRHPRVTRDERRHRERRGRERGPQRPGGQVGALDEPCERRAEQRARERRGERDRQRVDQQFADERAPQQLDRIVDAEGGRAVQREAERQQDRERGPHAAAATSARDGRRLVAVEPPSRAVLAVRGTASLMVRAGLPGAAACRPGCRRRAARTTVPAANSLNGFRIGSGATPGCSGYSKLIWPPAIGFCARSLTRYATNFCASGWRFETFSTAAPDTLTAPPTSPCRSGRSRCGSTCRRFRRAGGPSSSC